MHIGGGPSKCWILGLEPSGAGQSVVMGPCLAESRPQGGPARPVPRAAPGSSGHLLMANAVAGGGQFRQARLADRPPAGFALPITSPLPGDGGRPRRRRGRLRTWSSRALARLGPERLGLWPPALLRRSSPAVTSRIFPALAPGYLSLRYALSPISRNAAVRARTTALAVSGERWATRPAPGRPTSSTVSSTRRSAHGSQSSRATTDQATGVRSGSSSGWSSRP